MNPVLILTRNNIELTKKCVESVRGQDVIPSPYTLIFDNGSWDGTSEWLPDNHDPKSDLIVLRQSCNRGVSAGWNWSLDYWFDIRNADHVLVLNNDVLLPSWFYRHILSYPYSFVTGISVDQMSQIEKEPEIGLTPSPHPDMSAFLIRRECWERVGKFDESMKHYASDMDYHVRGHRAGVEMMNSGVPFYHERSSTIKNASPEDRREIETQANLDRAAFRAKWGVECNSPDYQGLFR